MTITLMKINVITNYYCSRPKTINEKIIPAKQMAHLVEEHLQYIKNFNL